MFKLKRNMGTADRISRTMIGAMLLTIGPLTDLVPTDLLSNIIVSGVASLALVSAACAYCFLYEVTGFDTGGKQG